MCFTIPYKVLKVDKNTALIEGGKTVKIRSGMQVKKGEYLRLNGPIIVDTLTKTEGDKIRQLIKRLNN